MGKIKSEQEVYNDTSGKTAIYQGVQPWQKNTVLDIYCSQHSLWKWHKID